MLCSFATITATSSKKYVRPKLVENGPIAILQGRHPVQELRQGVEFQPNDTYITTCSSCHIITGPNMSGKSTYLKQVTHTGLRSQIHWCECLLGIKFFLKNTSQALSNFQLAVHFRSLSYVLKSLQSMMLILSACNAIALWQCFPGHRYGWKMHASHFECCLAHSSNRGCQALMVVCSIRLH